jgi:hypothetical protein
MHFRQVQIYEKKWFMPKKPVIQIQVLTLYFEGSLKSSISNTGIIDTDTINKSKQTTIIFYLRYNIS